MTQAEIIAFLNDGAPPVWTNMRARVCEIHGPRFGGDEIAAVMSFDVSKEFCHSEVIVQGGMVSAMLDSTMTCALFGHFLASDPPRHVRPASLELKTSYLRVANNGLFLAKARVRKLGRTIAFQEADLYQDDKLVATASMTSQLSFA